MLCHDTALATYQCCKGHAGARCTALCALVGLCFTRDAARSVGLTWYLMGQPRCQAHKQGPRPTPCNQLSTCIAECCYTCSNADSIHASSVCLHVRLDLPIATAAAEPMSGAMILSPVRQGHQQALVAPCQCMSAQVATQTKARRAFC